MLGRRATHVQKRRVSQQSRGIRPVARRRKDEEPNRSSPAEAARLEKSADPGERRSRTRHYAAVLPSSHGQTFANARQRARCGRAHTRQ